MTNVYESTYTCEKRIDYVEFLKIISYLPDDRSFSYIHIDIGRVWNE